MIRFLQICDRIEDVKALDEFVYDHPMGTFFHSSSWILTLIESYSFKPVIISSCGSNSKLNMVFPLLESKGVLGKKRLISLPFSDYCGLLYSDEFRSDGNFLKLINELTKMRTNIEARNELPEELGFNKTSVYNRHILNCMVAIEDIYRNFDRKTIKYSIRKAEKSGVEIIERNSNEGINEFYRLNKMTRKKHGMPAQPKKFFTNLYKNIIKKGTGKIFLAKSGTEIVSGGLFFFQNDVMYYKYNVSNPLFLKTHCPNHLLTWHAIQYAKENNYSFLDFGRTHKKNVGLNRYKEMWGAIPKDIHYNFFPHQCTELGKTEESIFYSYFTKVWKRLPCVITDNISPLIYKYLQ